MIRNGQRGDLSWAQALKPGALIKKVFVRHEEGCSKGIRDQETRWTRKTSLVGSECRVFLSKPNWFFASVTSIFLQGRPSAVFTKISERSHEKFGKKNQAQLLLDRKYCHTWKLTMLKKIFRLKSKKTRLESKVVKIMKDLKKLYVVIKLANKILEITPI